MGTLWAYLFLIVTLTGLATGSYQGCYQETMRKRHFSVSPGDYRPELMTTTACMASCGTFNYIYAALTNGKFCYCADTLPAAGTVDNSFCDMPCVGDSQQKCGSTRYVSVYSSMKKVTGLVISTDATSILQPAQPVSITIGVDTGVNVVYRFDYDDGAGKTGPNATDMGTITYYLPGQYDIKVYANDVNNTFQDQVAASSVLVDAQPKNMIVECDTVFGTFEEGQCMLTLWWGTSVTLQVSVEGTSSLQFDIEDPPLSLAGPAFNDKVVTAGDTANNDLVLKAAEFGVSGRLMGFEMDVHVAGTITVMILRPQCSSGTYCYASNSCSGSCASTSQLIVSCPANAFCAQESMCTNGGLSCNALASRYASNPTSYQVLNTIALAPSSGGYQYMEYTDAEIFVEPGDILGIKQLTGDGQLNRVACDATDQDLSYGLSAGPYAVASGTGVGHRLAIRGVASGGSKVYLPFTFFTPGNLTLQAYATSSTVGGSAQAVTVVRVLAGVNASIIAVPEYVVTAEPVVITVEPHTGDEVRYNWTFSDGTEFLESLDRIKTYTFATPGPQQINVTVYNGVSSKENSTDVIAEDRVSGLTVAAVTLPATEKGQVTEFDVTLSGGTNYTCYWDHGDGTAIQQTDSLSEPLSLSPTRKQHNYAAAGTYTVNVTCANHVTSETVLLEVKVQERITDFAMVKEGANKNEPFSLQWSMITGTDVNFDVTFDNSPLTTFTQQSTYLWSSTQLAGRGVQKIPLYINASNLVSSEVIDIEFEILSVIVNPNLTASTVNTTSSTPVTFTVNLDAGSGVVVDIDFRDGNTDSYSIGATQEWSAPHQFIHVFTSGGIFNVKATFTNAEGSYEREVEVLVLVSVNDIECDLEEYALYHPPSPANLTLIGYTMPTEPTLTIHWGEPQSYYKQFPLVLNSTYQHEFGDTGTFRVNTTITNAWGTRTCLNDITIVERLVNPHFASPFNKAAFGLPYTVTFCLYRGPSQSLCNLTFDFGDGNPSQVYEREGYGKDGCDSKTVIYDSYTTKTIKVEATTPLESAVATTTVEVINGVDEADVVVITGGDVSFGDTTTFTLQYNGATMPTSASVFFEFGDDSTTDVGPHAFTIVASGGTQTFNHVYEKDGLFEAKVNISNEATNVQKIVQVGVYKQFVNLKMRMYFFKEIPLNEESDGIDQNSYYYPVNKAIHFHMTDDNNAVATSYQITVVSANGGSVLACIKTTPMFSIQINESGVYEVEVVASNPMSTATATRNIEMYELVQGMEIKEVNAQVKANEEKEFDITFTKQGTNTCLYLDFGDGMKWIYSDNLPACTRTGFTTVNAANKGALTGLSRFSHIYTRNNYYVLTAIAENLYSTETQELSFSITPLDCGKPSVDIDNRHHYFSNPKSYIRSTRIQIRGLSSIHCATSYDNVKSWRVEKMDSLMDTVIENITLVGVNSSRADLTFPARYLELGLYRLHYTMEMVGSYGTSKFQATTHTYIQVIASELIGVMMEHGVSEIERGPSQTVQLRPLDYSLDPDVDPADPQGLSVDSWECKIYEEDDDTGCAASGFVTTGSTQNLNVASMTLGKVYEVKAHLSKDSRTTTTTIFIHVVAGTPPEVSIQSSAGSVIYQVSDGYKVLKSSSVGLTCTCVSGCTAGAQYLWNIFVYDYRWSDGWRPLDVLDLEGRVLALQDDVTSNGYETEKISIQPSLFEDFNAELLRAECVVTSGTNSGRVATNLRVNQPPSGGTCSVTPLNRTITTSEAWTITVDGWSDDDGIEEYQFFIHKDRNTVDKQITSVSTGDGSLAVHASLSEGPDYLAYKQTILVKIRDTLGSVREYDCGQVVVLPMPVSEIRALAATLMTDQMHEMERRFAEGVQPEICEKVTMLASLLNSDSKRSRAEKAFYKSASNYANSMYGTADEDRPSYQTQEPGSPEAELVYEAETQRNTRAAVRKKLIVNIAQLVPETVLGITQVTSALSETSLAGDEVDQESQLVTMGYLESAMNFLENPDNMVDIPPEEVFTLMDNVVSTIGCISDAAGNNGFFPTLDDLQSAMETDAFVNDYDSSQDAVPDPDFDPRTATDTDGALEIMKAKVHRDLQAKTSAAVRQQETKLDTKMAKLFNQYTVPGQSREFRTLKKKVVMEKSNVANLEGKQLTAPDSEGGVVLPNSSFLTGIGTQSPVVISLGQGTNFPMRYSSKAKGIGASSNFITINIYDENNQRIPVDNLAEPVKVTIPRDANMPIPAYQTVDPIIPKWSNLMHFVAQINRTQSSVHLDFEDIKGRQFLMVIKLVGPDGKGATIAEDPADDECDFVFLMPPNTEDVDAESYRFFLSNTQLGDFIGTVSIGIRELNDTEMNMDISGGCSSLPRYPNGSDYFTGEFKLRQYVSQCLAIAETAEDWSTDGCVVGKETDPKATVCYCTHLTTFAGGWVVVPNTIDWGYVFANADFLSNPTIYVTQIVIVVLFILAAIYARYRDKKISETLGIAPLADNDPRDKYFYEVMVSTGMRRNAGTNSQVCFVISGEDDETDVRAFTDSKRKIFRRGNTDGFLMSVPRPLGHLNFMRIWHDNSGKGKFGSWFLNYIVVRDVQTDVKQVFVANKWFAVEEGDGQVDRVIPVAGREQLSDFSYQFGERSKKNLADGHLWFSVVARPPQSRFTCLQRVSCILCLLYVTMLANAMFYNTSGDTESSSNTLSFGPFSVSPEQIFIGVVSNLIVFPVNFLLVMLFRKSRPHHKRPSRIDRAIKEVHEQNKQASINDVKPEVSSIFSVAKSPTLPLERPNTSSSSRPGTAQSRDSDKELVVSTKKKKKFELPWYCTIIAWILLWLVTLGAALMVTFYGISFKDETCRKWISSLIVSFFMSVFVTQPIKVFLFAIILSIIIKNPAEDKEDEEEDEEMPHVDPDSQLLHSDSDAFGAARPRKIGYKPPDPVELEKHRKRRLNEIKMWGVIREVIIYSFFLWILMVISFRQLGASNFLYKDTMVRTFIANNETDIDFHTLRNTEEFWKWAKSGLVNGLRAGSYYNNFPPVLLKSFLNDKVSRILGYATLRQLRIKPALCEIPRDIDGLIEQCNVAYEILDQEEGTFKRGWEKMQPGDSVNDTDPWYIYSTADSLNGYPYWGTLSIYSGGGYVVPLKGSKQDLIDKLTLLEQQNWIDRYTRAVFVEFTAYNPQVNLFAISTILAEFHPSGGLVQSYRFEPAMLLPYMSSAMLFQLVCEIVYIAFVLFFIIRELRAFIKERLSYFKNFWNLVELGIISFSIAAIVVFFYRLFVTNDLVEVVDETAGNGYVKFQYVGYWNEIFSYMIGFLCFLSTIKFLKLLRFNRKINMLSATLRHSAKSLLHFSIIFVIVFMAFSQLFYLTYMHIDLDYSTFISSVAASILMMMGKFNIYSMTMAEPILTQVFVLLFVITVTFIIVNIFVSILNETFTVVREDLNKQGNDYEIVDFMLARFKKWTGIGAAPPDEANPNADPSQRPDGQGANGTDHVQDFPDRIERLLQSISAAYMDNDNLGNLYQKKRFQSENIGKNLMRTGRTPSPAPGQGRKDSSDVVARVHTD